MPGKWLGLAGLLGSGRTETASILFGVEKPDQGSMTLDGKSVQDYSPLGSIKRGVALCPEDRKAAGIVDDLTVRENIILAMQASQGWFKYLSLPEQYEIAEKYIKLLNIATPSADQPVKNLSGGNQQKVILARWLATNPQVLILDEPTRGIDVGTKAEIQKLVLSWQKKARPASSFPLNWRKSCAPATALSFCVSARKSPSSLARWTRTRSSRPLQGVKHEKAREDCTLPGERLPRAGCSSRLSPCS